MDPLYLSEEELNYELALRHIRELGSATRRIKGVKLRAIIKQEFAENKYYDSSEHAMAADVNINHCQQQIKILIPMIETALKKRNTDFLTQTRSRLYHYRNRLAIVKTPRDLIDTHASLSLLVKYLIEDISVQLGETVITEASDQVDDTEEGAASLEYQQQQHQNTLLSTEEHHNRSTESQTNQQSSSSTGAISKHSNVSQQVNTVHQHTSSPIQSAGRGRGRGVRVNTVPSGQNPGRFTIPQQGLEEQNGVPRPGMGGWRNEGIPSGTPPPAYNPPTGGQQISGMSNTDRLRDELLMQLLRREQNMPGQDRPEAGRSLKAVHNWPFKFKGEKDTTSLNTFLDRVETFARSEGLSDDILLKSVKHLLLDDALDWYGRAVAQHRLYSWEAFKNEIRKEYLPSSYSQILKLEAIFRYQAPNESFSKYYRDISALFRFVQPPMSEEEKYFIVKKNMNGDYATIVTAARPHSLAEMVEICSSYDETRMLLNRQKRLSIPHNSLLEPSFATPSSNRPQQMNQGPPRFGRVHAVNTEEELIQNDNGYSEQQQGGAQKSADETARTPADSQRAVDKEDWKQKFLELSEQVNALRLRQDTREDRGQRSQQNQQPRQNMEQSQPQVQEQRRAGLVCWNCDEDGHRFMDCPKPQAVMFCYRCGHKGYSLRNCPTCRAGLGNGQAGSH